MAIGLDDIAMAAIGILIEYALDKRTQRISAERAAHENKIRSVFNTIRDRYGVTLDQLNQKAEQYGIQLNRLADSARGSARLSQASKAYREYLKDYPSAISRINSIKNQITQGLSNLNYLEAEMTSNAMKGKEYSDLELAKIANKSITEINTPERKNPEEVRNDMRLSLSGLDRDVAQAADSMGLLRIKTPTM